LKAAARAGVTPQTPGVTPGGQTSGFGARRVDTWIAPFDTFKLGDESIQHSRLRIGAGEMGESDMLLGADFFLSHRVYVARSQHKIYFTYNGGPVFNLSPGAVAQMAAEDKAAAPAPEPAAAAKTQAGPPDLNLPVDAAGFDRRGAAFVARLDYAHAIADFSRATELAPADPKPVYDRATAYIANHQPVLAMSDLDQVMRLKPDDVEALIARAALYAAAGDKSRARSDLDAAAKLAADPQEVMRIALLYDGMDLFEQAVVQFDRWIMINPKGERMAIALNGRCWARAVLKTELDKAMADCNAALKLVPRQPAFLDSRALVHQDCGEWDAAIADYDAVLKDHPKASLSLYARGVAKTRKGLKEDGAADLAAATTLAPKIADQAKRFGLTP
jgi:tetratricopeptide (TPR) repeat protein